MTIKKEMEKWGSKNLSCCIKNEKYWFHFYCWVGSFMIVADTRFSASLSSRMDFHISNWGQSKIKFKFVYIKLEIIA